ncbi:Arylsulfatase precursor [Planctomycetes bacterium MalM25]|nr:Arylsulfatase precursor [Planctomycetes bacterium MalM25]
MMHRLLLLILLLLGGVQTDAKPPHFLVIVADDLGWNDVGYHNPEIRTPHLDRLAAEGVRLEQHYVMPQCTPTRVALMTGRYPSRFGEHCMQASNEQAFPLGTPTLASVMKDAGYETALCGKWHLGSKVEWGPQHYGFDHYYGSLAGAVGVYDHRYRLNTPFADTWTRNGEPVEEVGDSTDLVTAEAIRLLKAPREKPLLLYVPYQAVHTPLIPKPEWMEVNRHIEETDRQWYAAVVSHMDDCVGQLLHTLDETGQRDNTVVLFLSDNGAQVHHSGEQYPPPDFRLRNFSSNKPLRGAKTEVFEGGMRVPAIVSWPGELAPGVCDAPLHAVDWLPTLARVAGTEAPADTPLDGRSVWPALTGDAETQAALEARTLYWAWGVEKRRRVALREGDWKALRNGPKAPWRLFNLVDDPYEENDLAEQQPERLAALQERLDQMAKGDANQQAP